MQIARGQIDCAEPLAFPDARPPPDKADDGPGQVSAPECQPK